MQNVSEHHPKARKDHWCDECGRPIRRGTIYTKQVNKDGGDIWTFRAHTDCMELGTAYRNKHNCWRGHGDFLPMYELIEPHEMNEWRGLFPHAVCRLEFTHQTRD